MRHLAVRSCDIVSNASEFQSLDPTAPAKRAGVILVFYCYFSEIEEKQCLFVAPRYHTEDDVLV